MVRGPALLSVHTEEDRQRGLNGPGRTRLGQPICRRRVMTSPQPLISSDRRIDLLGTTTQRYSQTEASAARTQVGRGHDGQPPRKRIIATLDATRPSVGQTNSAVRRR